MIRRILVGDNERVLITRKGRFAGILTPGEYWMVGFGLDVERASVKDVVYAGEWVDYIVHQAPDEAARAFTTIETGDEQVAVVYFDGKLSRVIAPAKRVLFWKAAVEVTFELIDVRAERAVPERLVAPLARLGRESMGVCSR